MSHADGSRGWVSGHADRFLVTRRRAVSTGNITDTAANRPTAPGHEKQGLGFSFRKRLVWTGDVIHTSSSSVLLSGLELSD
jgi:hypothetical protein